MSADVDAIAVVGAGPAGLMAAETLAGQGHRVIVYDAMPSAGRKLLVAGSSGLNLTHAEPLEAFLGRYGDSRSRLEQALRAFGPEQLRAWCDHLGIPTHVGSSGRVFPVEKTGAGLLKSWTTRLVAQGVEFRFRHRWTRWNEGALVFETPEGPLNVRSAATVLALGGSSWPETGSTGAWVELLHALDVEVAPFRPANCGFLVDWSAPFLAKHRDAPLKSVAILEGDLRKTGELLITERGLEGSLIYAVAATLRDRLASGPTSLVLDLAPDVSEAAVAAKWGVLPGGRSVSTHLAKALGLPAVKIGLLHEATWPQVPREAGAVARLVKACPVRLTAAESLERAISSAGGVLWSELGADFQLKRLGNVFCAGEMLDWEAPTGGYLLTACWATGRAAGEGAVTFLKRREEKR